MPMQDRVRYDNGSSSCANCYYGQYDKSWNCYKCAKHELVRVYLSDDDDERWLFEAGVEWATMVCNDWAPKGLRRRDKEEELRTGSTERV